MGLDIDEALKYVVAREGSDLHVKVESPPVARVHGDLWALKGSERSLRMRPRRRSTRSPMTTI